MAVVKAACLVTAAIFYLLWVPGAKAGNSSVLTPGFRPPSVPLVVVDPYLRSVWLVHWVGAESSGPEKGVSLASACIDTILISLRATRRRQELRGDTSVEGVAGYRLSNFPSPYAPKRSFSGSVQCVVQR